MILQTWNNFLIGTTLSWFEVVAPILGYISVIKTFHDVIFYICKEYIYEKGDKGSWCGKCYLWCYTACYCIVPCILIAWVPVNFTVTVEDYRSQPSWVTENFDIVRMNEKAHRDAIEAIIETYNPSSSENLLNTWLCSQDLDSSDTLALNLCLEASNTDN